MSKKISFVASAKDVTDLRSFLGHKGSCGIIDKGIVAGKTVRQICGDLLGNCYTREKAGTARTDSGRGGRSDTFKAQLGRLCAHLAHLRAADTQHVSTITVLQSAGISLDSRLSFDADTLATAEKLGEYIPGR